MFSIVAAVGQNGELGKNGKLCFHLPGDLQFFKELTMHHKVLMGRKTYESLPSKGLPNRELYVATRAAHYVLNGAPATLVHHLNDFIKKYATSPEEVYVIGGSLIYQQLINYTHKIYLTEVAAACPEADTLFPNFEHKRYKKTILGERQDHGIKYTHVLYTIK